MSTLSPTLTLSNTVGSTICRLYFHPFGPTKVTRSCRSRRWSRSSFSARCRAPGCAPCPAVEVPVSVSTGASPGGFSLAETLLYVIDTLSSTLAHRTLAALGTSTVSKRHGFDVHDALGMIDGCHGARNGDCLCRELFDLRAQPGRRAKTNPDAPGLRLFPSCIFPWVIIWGRGQARRPQKLNSGVPGAAEITDFTG
jgi:hypothetical protein